MGKLRFCQRCVYLDRRPISFAGRPYLPAIYAADRNLVLRCSRQTEKSTFLVNTILYEACTNPGIQMLFVCPRQEQARVFSHTRLIPSLEQSPLVRRTLLGSRRRRPQVTNLRLANESALFVRAAYHSGDSCRGLSASLLLVDEFQDVAEGDLPVLQETMSHAQNPRTILTGTPKSVDNHLEWMFVKSTGHEWTIACPHCNKGVILDERSLAPTGLACPDCGAALDPQQGRWIARNPQATWGDGFWVCHPMVPWLNYDEILQRQRAYDLAKFKNEVLGLSTTAGEHVVTREELEACCTQAPMANSLEQIPAAERPKLIAGIDWGGGGTSRTVMVIGYMRSDYTFQLCRFERFAVTEEPDRVLHLVAQRCKQFRVQLIAADGGGNGHVYNRLLLDRLGWRGELYAILYSAADHEPRQDGALIKWTVNRSASIGVLFSRVKKQLITFPRVEDCGCFLDEFACEVAEYDDLTRTIRYSHPETQQDDALHATNYALLLAVLSFSDERRSIFDCN
ncbi:MAG: phage terminase large subunit family protein [Planctomycetes bacterium]|nr:phage terminase large subunit family protein [Planctomycetota bacterium]